MKVEIEVSSKRVIEKMVGFLESETDDCYTKDIPYPPSKEYTEFLNALKKSIQLTPENRTVYDKL